MGSPAVRIARSDADGIAVVTIDWPPANALDPDLLAAGLAVLDDLEREPPSAVILTGSGAFFSGGANLRVVPDLPPDAQSQLTRDVNALFSRWHTLERPVVTAVNGHAVAGGLVLALCGDHRVVGRSGRFGLTEVKVGIPFPSAAMAVVQSELAPAVARRLVLRGELFDAATATELGVFDECVADDEVLPRAHEVATELAALPPQTFTRIKLRLRGVAGSSGGAEAAPFAIAESKTAARAVLDGPRS